MTIGVAIASGCVADDGEAVNEVVSNITVDNGISSNGISLNGISLNGISLNGISLNGISLNGISLNGISLNGVSASGHQLQGVKSTGGTVSGANLVGAALRAQLSNGATLALRIDASALLPAPNADLRSYAISYATTAGWVPLCSGANQALVFPGTWNLTTVRHQNDSNMFSVACRGSTFAKCAELGYKGDSLLDTYHQTCIRALRADYCGDGQSNTLNGTLINVYDKLGRQVDTESWTLESNWNPDGAVCLKLARIASSLTWPKVPWCVAERANVPCSAPWQSNVLLRTEIAK